MLEARQQRDSSTLPSDGVLALLLLTILCILFSDVDDLITSFLNICLTLNLADGHRAHHNRHGGGQLGAHVLAASPGTRTVSDGTGASLFLV